MAQHHEIQQEIHCPPERMWELFFSTPFNVEMYVDGMGFPSCEVPELRDDGEVLHRRMVCVPKVELPKALQKVVGDRVGYEEIGDWVRREGAWNWKLVLAAFGDKVRITGTMRLVPHGDGHCMRKVAFDVDAKIFGIGGIVEKTSAQNVLEGWANSARWINGWLARNPA